MLQRVLAGPKANIRGAFVESERDVSPVTHHAREQALKTHFFEELRWKNDDELVEEASQVMRQLLDDCLKS